MQFYDVIENRTSIKKFKNSSIPHERIERMIEAAMMSPSWKNKTSYKFIIVDDDSKRQKLSEAVLNSSKEAAESVREAPLTAVVVSNPAESGTVTDRDYYLVDSAIAMEHFILAATEEGYGTCWIASIDEDKIRGILDIPNNFRVVAMTPVGETAEKKEHYEKKAVSDFVFLNSWNKSYINENTNIKH